MMIEDFTGSVLTGEHDDYDDARAVWNVLHDRRPGLIAQCTSPQDVAAAIAHAKRHDLRIAVRGGGHSLPGHSTVDGGIVIDLRKLAHVDVDPGTRTVRVGGGALLGDVDRGAQEHGLVVPAGVVSHTGVGGLTLGGGVGRLMRRFGLTVDSLLEVEIVLLDGSVVRAADDERPELFWALRGGGGNFGIVTEFTFRAHELSVLPILATFSPLDRAKEILEAGERAIADPATPDALLWTSFLRKGPDAPWMLPELVGRPGIMTLIEWSGELEEGRARLCAIEAELNAACGSIDDVPYLAIQQITDELLAPGTLHAYVKAGFSGALTDELIATMIERGVEVGSPMSVIEVLSMGGAIDRVDPASTAFAHRGARWLVNVPAQWADPADSEAEIAWVRGTFAALEPHLSGGAYSNFMEGDETESAGVAYGATLDRLRRVKAQYDPENLLRLNANVEPAEAYAPSIE